MKLCRTETLIGVMMTELMAELVRLVVTVLVEKRVSKVAGVVGELVSTRSQC